MASDKKVYKFRNQKKDKLGIIIFLIILLYITIGIVLSLKSDTITGYQVKNGMLSENRTYSGIALRNETVSYADRSGYINYFLPEGERFAYNNLIYCIDESGKLSDLIGKNPSDDNSLSKDELRDLEQDLSLFSRNFDPTIFNESVSFENSIETELTKIKSRRIIDDVSTLTSKNSNDIIDYYRSTASGIALYYLDGFESKTSADLVPDNFKIDEYESTVVVNDELVSSGNFTYKFVSDENWSVCIYVPSTEVERIIVNDYVEVKFLKNNVTSWGKVKLINSFPEGSVIELSFTNSMVTYAKDRFVDIELLLEEDTGLKIPNSSIAEKKFFLVDKSYVTKGSNSSDYIVLKKEYSEEGETVRSIKIEIEKEEEDYYYVDTLSLNYGDVLIKPEAAVTDTTSYIVGNQGTLIGVYNINKGYADFVRIEILYSNDEYSIIKPNSTYGLRTYDYIALDAETVTDKDFVY